MSDLVERLRAVVNAGPDFLGNDEGRCVTCSYRNPDGPEAADEMERLYARVEDLEGVLRGIAGEGEAARSILGPRQLRSTRWTK